MILIKKFRILYLVESLQKTKSQILRSFDKLNISLGEYQKHVRADVEIPIGGLVDMIAESSSSKYIRRNG